MTDKTAPESQLRLEWVYGYRGNQCRNNLYYTDAQNTVYFVAAVGVVHNPQDNSQQFFLGHTDDIISLALHPEKRLVATGQIGKDPFICVWDSSTLKTLSILQGGHERGITALSFSGDGNYLASVGLDDHHTVIVWDWKKGRSLASARGHTDKVLDVQFNPHTPGMLVTCGVRHIKFWTHYGNTLTGKKGVFGTTGELQSILCVAFGSPEVTYAGTFNGEVYKWKGNRLQTVIRAHSSAVYCIHHSDDGFATGSRDGTVKLWDNNFQPITVLDLSKAPTGYPGLCIRSVCWERRLVLAGTKCSEILEVSVDDRDNPKVLMQGHAEGELWGLAVHPTTGVFATGSDDQTIRLWDRKGHTVLQRCSTPHAVRSLAFSTNGSHLAAGMQDGSFTVYNTGTLTEVTHIKDRKEVLHEMKYSPDGQHLAVGSNDNFVDIYNVTEHYRRVSQCKGSSSFITHLDWSTDGRYIQTNSGAAERLFYRMPAGKQVTAKDEIQAIQWDTWTSVLGPEVAGMWPKYSQTNDINATSASFQHQTIVTGDDFGLVKLFRFPSLKKGAKFRKYIGHSAHVTNVRFTHDEHHVISVGGADHGVFQWRFLPGGMEVKAASQEQEDEQPIESTAVDSDSEESDSDVSDIGSVDSDLANEQEKTYERPVYREDLPELKKKLKEKADAEQVTRGVSASRAAASGKKQSAPEGSLNMHFVHGYRGYDCRNNLYYTQSGEIVYHIAAIGVVYNSTNHTQRFYLSHTDDILCLDMHPSKDYVATGQIGRDPAIHVWDAETMETLSILKGAHSRGVCAVDFSGDGKKLASVGLDDDHCIVVWDWRKGTKLAETRGHKDKIFMLQWNPASADHMITVGMKHIKFWTQAGGGFTSKRGIFGKKGESTTMLCVAFDKQQDGAHSGGANGLVYHWKGNQLTGTVKAHQGPVFAMLAVEKGFLTGGKDGMVALWDEQFAHCLKTYQLHSSAVESETGAAQLHTDLPAIRALSLGQNKILVGTKTSEILEIDKNGPIKLLIQGHTEGEMWGLAMHPSQLMCTTVSDDCTLRVWDISTNRMVASVMLMKPARCCCYSGDGKAIAVGMKDGSFVVLDTESLEEVVGFSHRKEEISDIKFSPAPTCKYLAVASHDNFVDIYNVASKKRVGICKGASSYVTHVDWDIRGKLLRINTGDSEVLYFEAPRGKQQYVTAEAAASIEWALWTSVLGGECQGVWPPYSDVTDVNTAHVVQDGSMIATGDDFGLVKIFSFPSKGKHAKFKEYVGHSAHVTNVRWSHDGAFLVSVGGADMSMVVWAREGATGQTVHCVDDVDSDSEEEGYDSDVEREKLINYISKTYESPVRDPSIVKPHQQQHKSTEKKPLVSRSSKTASLVKMTPSDKNVQELGLEFIFGYRGFDTRQNLFYTADGEVVFHAAGAGIVYNPLTRRQSFYLEHNDDIICLALSSNPKLKHICATGQIGKDGPVHVWDLSSKQTLSILQGYHSIGVCSVDFSSSGKLLLSVGLDNSFAVWRWTEGAKMAVSGGGSKRIFLAQFRPDSDVQFVSVGVRHVKFWTVAGSQLVSKDPIFPKSIPAKMQTMLSMAFAPEGITYTGSVEGAVFVWTGNMLSRVVMDAHSGPVFAMYTSLEDGLIVSAGKEKSSDGCVKLWDQEFKRCNSFTIPNMKTIRSVSRTKGKILIGSQDSRVLVLTEKGSATEVLIQGHMEGELWGLAVHPSSNVFVTASDDKTVRMWSIDTKELKCEHKLENCGRSVDFSPDGNTVAVGQTNGEFLLLSASDLSVMGTRRDRNKTIQCIRFSPSGDRLAVGSDDSCVDIYTISDLKEISRTSYCRGIPSAVTHMDWSTCGKYLQISTATYEKLVYDTNTGRQVPSSSESSTITWETWTSVLGPEIVGIWPRNADKADVNTACVTHSGSAVATGDDFGVVKLFDHFPITGKFTNFRSYYGHSAHVTSVKFTHDDEYLLTAGGDDSCVFVWRCQ